MSSGGSDEVRLKLACSATEASMRLEILVTETRDITLSRQRTTKVLIRLRGCAGWSAPLLFAYDIRHVFSWPGSTARLQRDGCVRRSKDLKTWFYCTKLTWCMLPKGKTIIWLMIYSSLTKSWTFWIFAGGFLVTIIFGTGLSLAQISQKWTMMVIWFSLQCDNRWSASQIWLIYMIVMVDHTAT